MVGKLLLALMMYIELGPVGSCQLSVVSCHKSGNTSASARYSDTHHKSKGEPWLNQFPPLLARGCLWLAK